MTTTIRMTRVAARTAAFLLAVLLSGASARAAAQVTVTPGEPCPAPDRGSLGITGLKCDHCSFSRGRAGFTQARFLTEPEVFAVDVEGTEGDHLRAGDVLVSIDGDLITTEAGARRLTSLQADDWVDVTVRRDGRTRQLRIRAARACDVTQPPPPGAPKAPLPPAGRSLPSPTPPGAATAPLPEPPGPPATSVRVGRLAHVQPAPAPAPPVAPGAGLGFGFECGPCSYRTDGDGPGRWSFQDPPVVYQVQEGGPAWAAGLRAGDVLLEVDGVDLTSPEGGRLFAAVKAGQPVAWTVRRGGRELVVHATPEALPATPTPPADPLAGPLRYAGAVGSTDVEVRGAPVSVSEDRERGVVVIRTGDVVVVIRRGTTEGGG